MYLKEFDEEEFGYESIEVKGIEEVKFFYGQPYYKSENFIWIESLEIKINSLRIEMGMGSEDEDTVPYYGYVIEMNDGELAGEIESGLACAISNMLHRIGKKLSMEEIFELTIEIRTENE